MKKQFFTIMVITFCSVFAFIVSSCNKDEDENKKCVCTESDSSAGYSSTQELDPKSYGATNCSDLAIKLRIMVNDDDLEYNCH